MINTNKLIEIWAALMDNGDYELAKDIDKEILWRKEKEKKKEEQKRRERESHRYYRCKCIFAHLKKGEKVSAKVLASRIGSNYQWVTAGLNELIEEGFIVRNEYKGKKPLYSLI